MNGPKENANPTVHFVTKKQRKSSSTQQFEPFGRWSRAETTADRAVFRMLKDLSTFSRNGNSNQKSANLLASVGMNETQNDSKASRSPCFDPEPIISDVDQQKAPAAITPTAPKINSDFPREKIDEDEVFEIIRNIQDPEHPLTLEQLNVVNRNHVVVEDNFHEPRKLSRVEVRFTPTIPHCSMATLIGLSLRVKLLRSLPPRFKVSVKIQPGTHASEHTVNKQLGDKERVCAALENKQLLGVVNKCIASGMKQ